MAQETDKIVLGVDVSQAIKDVNALKLKIEELTAARDASKQGGRKYRVQVDKITEAERELAIKTEQLSNSIDKETGAHKNSTLAIQSKINALTKEMRTMDISTKAYKQKALEVNKLSASMHQGRTATGLATTSAMEFGRVVSDAPYGIRGMANNVSQLTSLLFQGAGALDEATGKTIGLSGAIKGMWKAMRGPLGIMIAIQMVIAAIDYFAGSTKKAEDITNDFSSSIKTLTKALDDLKVPSEDINEKIEEYIALQRLRIETDKKVNETSDEIKSINARIDYNKELNNMYKQVASSVAVQGESDLITKGRIQAQKDLSKGMKHVAELEAKIIALTAKSTEEQRNYNDSLEEFNSYEEGTLKFLQDKISAQKKDQLSLSKTSEEYENLGLAIKATQDLIDDIQSPKIQSGKLGVLDSQMKKLKENQIALSQTKEQYAEWAKGIIAKQKEIDDFMGVTDDPKEPKKPKKPKKAFSLIDFDDTKTVRKFLKEQELLLAKSNVEKLDINQRYRVEDLQAVFDNEKKKDQIKLDTYLNGDASDKELELLGAKEEEKDKIIAFYADRAKKAKDLFNQKQIDSETKHDDALIELNLAGAYKRGQLNIKIEEDFRGTMHQNQLERTQAHLATMSNLLSDNSVESLEFLHEAQREVWAVEDEIFKQSLEKKREKLTAQGWDLSQIQIEIDEDKFAREQEVADREVQLEIDKINRKKEVNEEYVSYISGLGDVFAAFGKKNEFLAITGLALQKGAEIASVVIKTTAANSQISAAAAKDYSAAVTAGNSSVSQGFALMGNPATLLIGKAMVSAGGIAVSSAKAIPAAAKLAKNKNRIKAGMSIAKIAATTLTSGALGGDSSDSGGGGSTGGGGGGSTSFAPSFNVVGNSNENQLAEGIGGQVNMPTRAYVVYDDIQQAGSVVEESIENSGI